MAKKITKRINYTFEHRHFSIRIISYSFYEELLGANGTMSVVITDLSDGYSGKVKINVDDRCGWNLYTNKPNLHIMEDVIINDIASVE